MDTHDRYVLAAAMLSGDHEAELALADLLEEQGDEELADWARTHCKPGQRQVQIAIMLLPWPVAIALGVDFVQKAFDVVDWTIVRQWLAGEVSDKMVGNFVRGPLSKGLEHYWKAPSGGASRAELARLRQNALEGHQSMHIVVNALREAVKRIVLPGEDCLLAIAEHEARLQIRYIVIRTWHLTREALPMEEWQRLKTLEALQKLIAPPVA